MLIYNLHLSPTSFYKDAWETIINAHAYLENGQIVCQETGRLVIPKICGMRPCPPSISPPADVIPTKPYIVTYRIPSASIPSVPQTIPIAKSEKVSDLTPNMPSVQIPIPLSVDKISTPAACAAVAVPAPPTAASAAVPAASAPTPPAPAPTPVPAAPTPVPASTPVPAPPAVPAAPKKKGDKALSLVRQIASDPNHTHLECMGHCEKHPLLTPTIYKMMTSYQGWGDMMHDEEVKLKAKKL